MVNGRVCLALGSIYIAKDTMTLTERILMNEPLLDLIVVENCQGDGRLADSSGLNESDWDEVLGEINHLLD